MMNSRVVEEGIGQDHGRSRLEVVKRNVQQPQCSVRSQRLRDLGSQKVPGYGGRGRERNNLRRLPDYGLRGNGIRTEIFYQVGSDMTRRHTLILKRSPLERRSRRIRPKARCSLWGVTLVVLLFLMFTFSNIEHEFIHCGLTPEDVLVLV